MKRLSDSVSGTGRGERSREKNLFVSPPTKLLSQVSREGVGWGRMRGNQNSLSHTLSISLPLSVQTHTHACQHDSTQHDLERMCSRFCRAKGSRSHDGLCFVLVSPQPSGRALWSASSFTKPSHICFGSWLACTFSPAHNAGSTPYFRGLSLWRSPLTLWNFSSKKQTLFKFAII